MSEPVGTARFDYRAFISYSHQDKSWADWLHKALETYRVPSRLVGEETAAGVIPRHLRPIFRDRDELASATDLGRRVNEALAKSENLIVICSPRSASSRWVNEEVAAFERLGRSGRIFCLIVDGEPNATDMPGREAEECFVKALRFQLDATGQPTREPTEPIAADARAGKDGKANAKLKLIAGLLDVGFDALKQREMQRRNRRMAAITTLAVMVMLVTSVLAVYAVIARRSADVARQAAERRQKQAEGLIDFMLGDLNDKLAQVDRLDIMQAVDDKAMAYFQSLPTTDVTDKALAQRAKALEKIGLVRMNQGHLPKALDAFKAALKLSATLATAAPSDATRQEAYAENWAYIGTAHWYQGSLTDAQHAFEKAIDVLLRSAPYAGADPRFRLELAMLENNMGHIFEANGDLSAANVKYRKVLSITKKLSETQPDNAKWQVSLGDAYNNVGKLALIRGDLKTAITQYRADDVIQSRLYAKNPEDNLQRENALIVHATLGRTLALTGDVKTGTSYLRQALDAAVALGKVAPNNTSVQEDIALYGTQLSRLLRLQGDLHAAHALCAKSLSIFAALTAKNSDNKGWLREYAEARTQQAALSRDANRIDAARKQAQGASRILDRLSNKQQPDHVTALATVAAKLLLADVTPDPSSARTLRENALKIALSRRSGRNDPRLLALQAEALLDMGRKSQAMPAIMRLSNSGYRDPEFMAKLTQRRIAYPVHTAIDHRLQHSSLSITHAPARRPHHASHKPR